MIINHDGYIINDELDISAMKKKENWEIAIGLNEVDGLTPSKYLIELTKDSIEGKKSYKEVEEALKNYYKNQDLTDKTIRNNHECDLVSTRIAEILENKSFVFSPIYLKSIHEQLFKGVFSGELKEYAGKFRDYNITKEEPILGNDAVTYGNYNSLLDYLKYDFDEEKNLDYSKLSSEKRVERISKFTSSIWQVHPFGEGNTRIIAIFIQKYLINKGWDINNELFKDNSLYFRNALVLSNYSNMKKGVSPNFNYLNKFFEKLLENPNIELEKIVSI